MNDWRERWARQKADLAANLAAGQCGGTYGDAVLLLSSVLSALSAEVWPGENIDRKRFVELITKFAPPTTRAHMISVPLLIGALRADYRENEAANLKSTFLDYPSSRVVLGDEVDQDEATILNACGSIPPKTIRSNSYPNILYREIRSSYVHQYRPGHRANAHPMTSRDAGVSYVNWVAKPDRSIHFHIPWIAQIAVSVAREVDKIADKTPYPEPTKWWIEA